MWMYLCHVCLEEDALQQLQHRRRRGATALQHRLCRDPVQLRGRCGHLEPLAELEDRDDHREHLPHSQGRDQKGGGLCWIGERALDCVRYVSVFLLLTALHW